MSLTVFAVIFSGFITGAVTDRPWLVGVSTLAAVIAAVCFGAGSTLDEN